jgi:hypothetical protein
MGARRRGLQPGQEAGQGRVGHGELPAAAVGRAGRVGRRLGGHLHHDPAGAERRDLGLVGRAAGDHGQRPPLEDLLRAEQHAEGAVPVQLVTLIGEHAEPPAAVTEAVPGQADVIGLAGGVKAAQRALDRPAAALEQEAAGGEDDGGDHEEHQERGKQPHRVR